MRQCLTRKKTIFNHLLLYLGKFCRFFSHFADLEKLREFLVKYHSERRAVDSIIEFQSIGMLYLHIMEFKKEAYPAPSALLGIVETTLPR